MTGKVWRPNLRTQKTRLVGFDPPSKFVGRRRFERESQLCLSTLDFLGVKGEYQTHIGACLTPNSYGAIHDKLRMSSLDASYRTADTPFDLVRCVSI